MTNWRAALIEALDPSGEIVSLKSSSDGYLQTTFPDDASIDAFGRLRTSDTGQRIDVEFLYGKQEDFIDEILDDQTAGATPPTSTFNTATRDITLAVAATNNNQSAQLASHPVPYTPGNSQLIDITGVLDLAGIGGGTAEVFLRSSITGSVVEEVVDQSDWENLTTGVDWTKSHIFSMDFQSLKVGRIRYGMVVNGLFVKVAEITNDNERDSGYWQTPNLPLYWRVYNDSTNTYMEVGYGNDSNGIGFRYKITANASATMKAICCTAKSEGGEALADLPGLPRSIDNGTTVITAAASLIPILSIRPKSTWTANSLENLVLSLPKSFNVQTDNPIKIAIIHSGTLTGASWVDVDASESSVEYDVSSSAISGGHVVYSEYVTTSAKNSGNSSQGILGKTLLWSRKSSVSGVFTIAAVRTTATSAEVLAALQWEEIR